MAGAFESFVQLELPLRPFVSEDGAQESIAIRRGQGPRQVQFVSIGEGQVLAKVNGELKGVTINLSGGVKYFVADVEEGDEQSTWELEHNQDSLNFVHSTYELRSGELKSVIPDEVTIVDANTVRFSFGSAIAGKITMIFV